jgi:hypothetical protein
VPHSVTVKPVPSLQPSSLPAEVVAEICLATCVSKLLSVLLSLHLFRIHRTWTAFLLAVCLEHFTAQPSTLKTDVGAAP